MKVLVITNDFGPRAGGIESFVQALVERLPHGSAVVLTSSQEQSAPFDEEFSAQTGSIIIRDKSRILLPTPRLIRKAQDLITEHGISRVWFGAAAPLALMSSALRRVGVQRIVASTHGHEVWWSRAPIMRSLIRRIGNSVDVVTYLGDYTATHLAKALSSSGRKKMVRLAPGVDTQHFSPKLAHPIRQTLSAPVLVCVSRLVHRKGQDRLIDALPLIHRRFPTTSVLFVGTGPLEGELRRRASARKVTEFIHFTGRVDYSELPAYFCSGDIFVMPTRSRLAGLEVEGLGMVYLEASACGLPVVAGRSGGSPDAIIEGKTGLLVDDDVEQIAQVCSDLLANPDLMHVMGAAGRAWVEEQWQWNQIADHHQRLLALS